MLPCFASDGARNGFAMNTELQCDFRPRNSRRGHFLCNGDIYRGKFHFRNSLLLRAIRHVVRLSTDKQVIGVATRWIVAFMADIQTIWNRPIGNNPSRSMGDYVGFVESDYAIPTDRCARRVPQPAFIFRASRNAPPKQHTQWQLGSLRVWFPWFVVHLVESELFQEAAQ